MGTEPNNLPVGEFAALNCMAVVNTDIGPDMSSLHKEWYHNNEIITTDTVQRGANLQLQLKKVKTSLAGYYECLAWIDDNTLRNESHNILLYVNCEYSKCFKLARNNYSSVITSHSMCLYGECVDRLITLIFLQTTTTPNTNCILQASHDQE